jgi:hypothetical protein
MKPFAVSELQFADREGICHRPIDDFADAMKRALVDASADNSREYRRLLP